MQAYQICKDRLTKVQETLGQYFEKDEVKGEAGLVLLYLQVLSWFFNGGNMLRER